MPPIARIRSFALPLLVSGIVAGGIIAAPVGAHIKKRIGGDVRPVALGHLMSHIESRLDERYVNAAETAANAATLGGLDSTAFQPRSHWAYVAKDATILAQSGGISAETPGSGRYYLHFPTRLDDKGIFATRDWKDAKVDAGTTSVNVCGAIPIGVDCSVGPNTVNDLYVRTEDASTGTPAPGAFYVLVIG